MRGIPVGGCVDAAPEHQHGIRESVPEGTPDLILRNEIRIRDTAPIFLRTRDGDELTEWIWYRALASRSRSSISAPRAVYSAKIHTVQSLLLTSLSSPGLLNQSRNDQANGVLRFPEKTGSAPQGSFGKMHSNGAECFTMLTTGPSPDVAHIMIVKSPYSSKRAGARGWTWRVQKLNSSDRALPGSRCY
jgi:hypothetical protein